MTGRSCISCYPLQSGSIKEGFLEFMSISKFEMNVFCMVNNIFFFQFFNYSSSLNYDLDPYHASLKDESRVFFEINFVQINYNIMLVRENM